MPSSLGTASLATDLRALLRRQRGEPVLEVGVAGVAPVILDQDARRHAGRDQERQLVGAVVEHLDGAEIRAAAQLAREIDQEAGRLASIDPGRGEDAASGDRAERHADHQLGVVRDAVATRRVGEPPVAREVTRAVVLDVGGSRGHQLAVLPRGEMAGPPAAPRRGARARLERLEEGPAHERIVAGLEHAVPRFARDLGEIAEDLELDRRCPARIESSE